MKRREKKRKGVTKKRSKCENIQGKERNTY